PASGLSDQGVDALAFEAAFRLEAERLTGTDTLAVDAVGLWEAGSVGRVLVSFVDPQLSAASGALMRPAGLVRDLQALREATAVEASADVLIAVHPSVARTTQGMPSLDEGAAKAGLNLRLVAATSTDEVLASVSEATKAVYLDAGTSSPTEDLRALAQALTERSVVTWAASPRVVAWGWFASASADFVEPLARRAVLALVDSTRQDSLAAPLPLPARLTVNEATARQLGQALTWPVLLEAEFVETAARPSEKLNLADAVRGAAESNLAVRASEFAVDGAEAGVGSAWSALLPQVVASSTARIINEDLGAAALGGANPERLWTVEANLGQVLFSERAFAGVSIAERFAAAQRFERDDARLQAAQEGGRAFVGVLRAETGKGVVRDQARRALADLETAQLRQDAGEAGPADVARLQAELARIRQSLAGTLGGIEAARYALNQALNRPLDEPLVLDVPAGESPLDAPRALVASIPVLDLLSGPARSTSLAERYAQATLEQAPAIRALESVLSARKRQAAAVGRSLYLPEIQLFAGASARLAEGGAGLDLPPGLPIPPFPDETWSAGVSLQFPLFLGGGRISERRKAKAEAAEAQARLDLVVQQLVQGSRSAAAILSATYAAYGQAEEAARAAREAYDDVSQLYREGLVGVTDLVAAQEALRLTEGLVSTAAYDVVDAYIDLQRVSGSFDVLSES
ncbi:MAG: TolC family protein, partial [Bacteroidota bacterium]